MEVLQGKVLNRKNQKQHKNCKNLPWPLSFYGFYGFFCFFCIIPGSGKSCRNVFGGWVGGRRAGHLSFYSFFVFLSFFVFFEGVSQARPGKAIGGRPGWGDQGGARWAGQ